MAVVEQKFRSYKREIVRPAVAALAMAASAGFGRLRGGKRKLARLVVDTSVILKRRKANPPLPTPDGFFGGQKAAVYQTQISSVTTNICRLCLKSQQPYFDGRQKLLTALSKSPKFLALQNAPEQNHGWSGRCEVDGEELPDSGAPEPHALRRKVQIRTQIGLTGKDFKDNLPVVTLPVDFLKEKLINLRLTEPGAGVDQW